MSDNACVRTHAQPVRPLLTQVRLVLSQSDWSKRLQSVSSALLVPSVSAGSSHLRPRRPAWDSSSGSLARWPLGRVSNGESQQEAGRWEKRDVGAFLSNAVLFQGHVVTEALSLPDGGSTRSCSGFLALCFVPDGDGFLSCWCLRVPALHVDHVGGICLLLFCSAETLTCTPPA